MAEKSNKRTFGIECPEADYKHACDVLASMEGGTNGEKLKTMIDIVEESQKHQAMSNKYRDQLVAINASVANIKASAEAIVQAAAEERKLETEELRKRLASRDQSVRDLQNEREVLKEALKASRTAQAAAEETARSATQEAQEAKAKADSEAARYLQDRARYQRDVDTKEELIAFLHAQVAELEGQIANAAGRERAKNDE